MGGGMNVMSRLMGNDATHPPIAIVSAAKLPNTGDVTGAVVLACWRATDRRATVLIASRRKATHQWPFFGFQSCEGGAFPTRSDNQTTRFPQLTQYRAPAWIDVPHVGHRLGSSGVSHCLQTAVSGGFDLRHCGQITSGGSGGIEPG